MWCNCSDTYPAPEGPATLALMLGSSLAPIGVWTRLRGSTEQ